MTFIKAFITSILMIGLIVTTSPAALQYSGALSGTVVDELRRPLAELDYARHLWLEKSVQSTANVTRTDVRETLALAAQAPLRPRVVEYTFEQANEALLAIRSDHIRAAGVLRIHGRD